MSKFINSFKYISKIIPSKKYSSAITLHDIPPNSFDWLKKVIDQLLEEYQFVDPNDIEHLFSRENKNSILLTFDDGFYSSYRVCKEILNPRNIKGLFFIPSSFIGLKDKKAFNFCQKNIYPKRKIFQSYKKEFDAMTLTQIREIILDGHSIGAHTLSHPKLSSINNANAYREINLSADQLEEQLSMPISFFAFPFGSLDSINLASYEIAKKRFKYCFSNIRGGLSESPSRKFLFRQNLYPDMPQFLIKDILKGKIDWKYMRSRFQAKRNFSK